MLSMLGSTKQIAKDFLASRWWPKRPQSVLVEITAACDARCVHCPRLAIDRAMKPMPLPLWRKLVDEAAALGVPEFIPNGYGEICTIPVPALTEYFDYIAAKGYPFNIIINTNGNRMTRERAELFIKHRVKLINIIIDGATKETAESIRLKLDFDQIEANIHQLLALRKAAGLKYPKVRVGMIVMPQTIPEIDLFRRKWEGVADYVGLGGFSSRLASIEKGNTVPLVTLQGPKNHGDRGTTHLPHVDECADQQTCVLPFKELNIWADGRAVLCCEDWNEEFVVGDLNHQTLEEIWHGPLLRDVREKHRARQGRDIWLCERCNNWKPPTLGSRLWV